MAISGPKDGICHRRPSGPAEGSPASCRLQACPAGEPWHQFVGCGCRAGCDVLSYGQTHLQSAFGKLRGLVGSDGLSIMMLARRMRQPAQVEMRDRKVARGAARCIGMVAVVMLATAVDDRLSNSSLADRPPWPPRSHRAKAQVLLLALRMLFQSAETSRHVYMSEIYVPATHPVSLRPPTKRSRIQEAPKWLNLKYVRLLYERCLLR